MTNSERILEVLQSFQNWTGSPMAYSPSLEQLEAVHQNRKSCWMEWLMKLIVDAECMFCKHPA